MDQGVFVDANIFLEVVLSDAQREACKHFLTEFIVGTTEGYTSDFLVYACLLQIQHKTKDVKQMEKFIIFLNSIPHLTIIRASLSDMAAALPIMEMHKLDFDDALVISCMQHGGINTLVSFDADFDRIAGVRRVEPHL